MAEASFSSLGAAERARAVLDPGSFVARADLPADVPFAVGTGRLDGTPVVVALSDGHRRGGTFGVREASLLGAVLDEALPAGADPVRAPAVILGFDTGGVRVEEGPVALAAVSAVGVELAGLVARGLRVASVISGPRGCFGAPSVMAALPQAVIMTDNAHWGLTGPKLIERVRAGDGADTAQFVATSAAIRLDNGDADVVVADAAPAVRAALAEALAAMPAAATEPLAVIRRSRDVCAALLARLQASPSFRPHALPERRRRDLLRYSFRGQWVPEGEVQRGGIVQVALGSLGERRALGLVLGPEQGKGVGVGIEEAALVTAMLDAAVRLPGLPAAVLSFVFCQGHAVDFTQERHGLHRALAECLRALVAARRRGHPLVSTLGGGTYGAAYLAFAAPSQRVLAMQGTSVAPMAPDVLAAFQDLRGRKEGHDPDSHLAELIPEVCIVESIIRLPRILRAELERITGAA